MTLCEIVEVNSQTSSTHVYASRKRMRISGTVSLPAPLASLSARRSRACDDTHVVLPHDLIGAGIRVNFALKVDVVALLDVVRVHVSAELQVQDRHDCNERKDAIIRLVMLFTTGGPSLAVNADAAE